MNTIKTRTTGKPHNTQPTERQRKAMIRYVEQGGKSMSRAMVESGAYSKASAHNPNKLTNSKGFQTLLKEYGLNEPLILKALVDDIKAKPQRRVGELRLGADILRMTGREPSNVSVNILNLIQKDKEKYNIGEGSPQFVPDEGC